MLHARGSPRGKKGGWGSIYTHYNSLTIMPNTPGKSETKTATSIAAICLTQFVLIFTSSPEKGLKMVLGT